MTKAQELLNLLEKTKPLKVKSTYTSDAHIITKGKSYLLYELDHIVPGGKKTVKVYHFKNDDGGISYVSEESFDLYFKKE